MSLSKIEPSTDNYSDTDELLALDKTIDTKFREDYLKKNRDNETKNVMHLAFEDFDISDISYSCSQRTCFACFCPCIIIGNIKSLTIDESSNNQKNEIYKRLDNCKFCFEHVLNINYGFHGRETCRSYIIPCCFLWPCSPILASGIHEMHEKLKTLYSNDKSSERLTRKSTYFYNVCLWPCILSHTYDFFMKMNIYDNISHVANGRQRSQLYYDWADYDMIVLDKNQQCNLAHSDNIVSVVGFHDHGRSSVFSKLLASTEFEISSEPKVGVKVIGNSQDTVHFLEVWDLPQGALDSITATTAIQKSVAIIFVYELNSSNEFESQHITELYDKIITILKQIQSSKTIRFYCLGINSSKSEVEMSRSSEYVRNIRDQVELWSESRKIDFFEVKGYFLRSDSRLNIDDRFILDLRKDIIDYCLF